MYKAPSLFSRYCSRRDGCALRAALWKFAARVAGKHVVAPYPRRDAAWMLSITAIYILK